MKAKDKFKELAEQFRKTQLWEYLTDSDVFGVELDDGRIAYCSVMGSSGFHHGLGVFIGARGFKTYLDSIASDISKNKKLEFERLATFEDIQLSFSDEWRADLWCQHPHQVPEPENCNDEEKDIMCQALEACMSLFLCIKVADYDVVAVGFDEYEEYPTKEGGKKTLLMKREGNGYIVKSIELPAYDTSDEEKLADLTMRAFDQTLSMAYVAPLQNLKKLGQLECRLIHYPMPIKEEGASTGYFAQALLTVSSGNGHILEPKMTKLENPEDAREMLMNLCKQIEKMGHCPLQISVPDMATEYFLTPFCNMLKIKLVREKRPLHQLNKAWDSLFSYCESQK